MQHLMITQQFGLDLLYVLSVMRCVLFFDLVL